MQSLKPIQCFYLTCYMLCTCRSTTPHNAQFQQHLSVNIPGMLSNSCTAVALALEQARCSGVRFRRSSWASNRRLTLFTSAPSSNWITSRGVVGLVSVAPPVSALLQELRGRRQAAMCSGVRPSLVRALRSSFSGVYRRACVCTFCGHVCDERQSFHNININD